MNRIVKLLVMMVVALGLTGCVLRSDFDPERLAELHWITPPATEVVEELVVSQPRPEGTRTPDPTAVAIEVAEEPQVACDIKVNKSGEELVYHMPDGAYYSRVKIDPSQGDSYACSEEEAIAAGARKSTR